MQLMVRWSARGRAVRLLLVAVAVGMSMLVGGVVSASSTSFGCVLPWLCVGQSDKQVHTKAKKKGFIKQAILTKRVCRFLLPPPARRGGWQCAVLIKGGYNLYVVSHRRKVVYAFANKSEALSSVGALRRAWGKEASHLRSIEGLNLFWKKPRHKNVVVGAFLRYRPKGKKKLSKRAPAGLFAFHSKRFRGSPYAFSFRAIRRISRWLTPKGRWPTRCFHTLCLGLSPKQTLALLQTQGYKPNRKYQFKHCNKMFSSSSNRGKLVCKVVYRSWSQSTMRLVWRKNKLIFAQAERLSRPPRVRLMRWVWGRETKKQWIRGMLFLQWRHPHAKRYILSVPLFGERTSPTPVSLRTPVGFILADWKWLGRTKMGQTLRGLLKIK